MTYRPDIDGLRAVAILPVVLYHAGIPGMSGGFVGVDVFFVISGFLITSIVSSEMTEGRFSLLRFYERRARRILPALTAVVLTSLVVGWFILLPSELADLGFSALATALFLSNFHFAVALDYFAPAAEFAPLLHTWSLAVEEQFYLFFPPLLAFCFTRFGSGAAVWMVLALSLLSFGAAISMLAVEPERVFYLIFYRAWELGIGALLALWAVPTPNSPLLRQGIGLFGLLAIVLPVVLYDHTTAFPGLAALPPVLGAAALIYIGSNRAGSFVTSALSYPVFVWIGLISYSLYLWHWPVLAFLRVLGDNVDLPLTIGIGAIAASVVLATLSYRFVEQPFRTKSPNGFSQRAVLSLAGGALLGMAAIGAILHVSSGMPNRLEPQVVAMAETAGIRNPDADACFHTLPDDGLCTLGRPAPASDPVDFLFWGDSHAEAMRSGLDTAAEASGMRGLFAGTSACPPIRQLRRIPERRRCSALNDAVWAFLQDRSDIHTVLLAARWSLSVEGTRYRGEPGRPAILDWAGAPETRPASSENATLFEAGLAQAVEEILATGRRVVLIGPVPEVGWHVPRALARAEMLGEVVALPPVTQADFEARSGRTERILSDLAQRHEDVTFLRLSDLFCADGLCAVTNEDGMPLYTDDDHISRRTAETLLRPRFMEIWASNASNPDATR